MNTALKIIYIAVLILLLAYYPFASEKMDKDIMSLLLVGVLVVTLLFTKIKHDNSLKNQYLRASSLFLLGYIIVHFQFYLDYVLGNIDLGNTRIWRSEDIVIKSFVLSFAGLIAFMLGYLFYSKPAIRLRKLRETRTYSTNFLSFLSTVLLGLYFFYVNPLYLVGYYGIVDMGTEATYISMVFELVVYAIIIQNCRNMMFESYIPSGFKDYVKKQGYYKTAIIVIYLLSVVFSGDRGPIMTLGVCYGAGYYITTRKKLTAKVAIPFAVISILVIFVLGEIRSLDKNVSFTDRFFQTFESENRFNYRSVVPATQVLGSSVRTLHATVDYIPNKHDYMYGRFQFQQIVVGIPFASTLLNEIYTDNHVKYSGSSYFITWIDQGEFPYSGEGTTCVADFYFDFGLLGVLVGMLFFGYLVRYIDENLFSSNMPSLFAHVLIISYLAHAIYIGRSSVLVELKGIIWIYCILLFNKYFFNRPRA